MALKQYFIIKSMLLVACWTAIYAQLHTLSDGAPVACDPTELDNCMQPLILLGFSGAGGNLAEFSENLTPQLYRKLCSAMENFTSCADGYTSRCTPSEGQPKVQLVARAMTSILSSCNRADGFSKLKKTVTCAVKITAAGDSCLTAAQANIPENERETSPANLYLAKNPQKNVCCTLKQFKSCVAPSVQNSCSADERTAINGFMDKVMEGFECTDAVYRTCSS